MKRLSFPIAEHRKTGDRLRLNAEHPAPPRGFDWRKWAQEREWCLIELRIEYLELDELNELFEVLTDIVPIRTWGDGLDTYEYYIAPEHAKTFDIREAASLLHRAVKRIERESVDEGIVVRSATGPFHVAIPSCRLYFDRLWNSI